MAGRENTQAFNKIPEVHPFFITRHSHSHLCADCSMLAGDSGLVASHKWDVPLHILFAELDLQCLGEWLEGWCPLSSKQLDLTVIASIPLPVSLWPSKYLPVQSRNACPGKSKRCLHQPSAPCNARAKTGSCLPTLTSKSALNILHFRSVL